MGGGRVELFFWKEGVWEFVVGLFRVFEHVGGIGMKWEVSTKKAFMLLKSPLAERAGSSV